MANDPNRITPLEPGEQDATEAQMEAEQEKADVKYHEWKESNGRGK